MQLDNDLLGVWLKAPTLTTAEIRFLIETIQEMRNQLADADDVAAYESFFTSRGDCNLQELATRSPPPRLVLEFFDLA